MDTTLTVPRRIQRSFGQSGPEGTVYVGAGSGWATPFAPGVTKVLANEDGNPTAFHPQTHDDAVDLFRWFVSGGRRTTEIRKRLAGKNLACWCPLDQPCHADVLLELANR